MKKIIVFLLIVCMLTGCDLPKKENKPAQAVTEVPTMSPTEIPTETSTEEITPTEDPFAGMPDEERIIRQRIQDEFTKTEIDSITINPNLATDDEDDTILLVYLTWTQKNSEETSKDMLSMYSDDLAVTISTIPTVQEIAVFWTVPYLDKNVKYSYERKGNGMVKADEVWQ